jgi:hypothetical protein
MLRNIEGYNNFSPKLRERLTEARQNAGKTVKYKFYIAHKNPDGEHRAAGEYIYPAAYTLTPVTYTITDPGDGLTKDVGMTTGKVKYGQTEELKFRRVEITERMQGMFFLDLQYPEQIETFEYLEMHPKYEGGMFRDKNIPPLFVRVDELKEAKKSLRQRELRSQALMVSTKMGEQEVRDFAAAMNWNELEDLDVLRDKLTNLADTDPEFFRKFVDDPKAEFKALIRRATDANIIAWIPVESKYIWVSNGGAIAMLEKSEGDTHFEQMADWLMAHKNGQDTYKKIKSLLSGK